MQLVLSSCVQGPVETPAGNHEPLHTHTRTRLQSSYRPTAVVSLHSCKLFTDFEVIYESRSVQTKKRNDFKMKQTHDAYCCCVCLELKACPNSQKIRWRHRTGVSYDSWANDLKKTIDRIPVYCSYGAPDKSNGFQQIVLAKILPATAVARRTYIFMYNKFMFFTYTYYLHMVFINQQKQKKV